MSRDDFYDREQYDRDQEEWRRRREREQEGEFRGRSQWESGQSAYGQGGYGHAMYGQAGYGQGFGRSGESGEGWYGRSGYGLGGYSRGEYGRGEYGRSGHEGGRPSGYEQSQWRGGYEGTQRQGSYSQSGYGQGVGYASIIVGRFYGRGPKGYQRSDDRILEDVSEELFRNPDIDAGDIEVQVQNGEVTLTGKVEDRRQKRLAEDLAEGCSGVKDVHNQLKVDKGFFAKLFGTGEDDREREREQERPTATRRTTSTTANR